MLLLTVDVKAKGIPFIWPNKLLYLILSYLNEDQVGQKEAETFLTLFNNEWTDSVSSVALASLKTNKFNKPTLLPVTSDLNK